VNNQLLEALLREDEGTALDFKRDQYPFVGVIDDSVKSELLKDSWLSQIHGEDQMHLF